MSRILESLFVRLGCPQLVLRVMEERPSTSGFLYLRPGVYTLPFLCLSLCCQNPACIFISLLPCTFAARAAVYSIVPYWLSSTPLFSLVYTIEQLLLQGPGTQRALSTER